MIIAGERCLLTGKQERGKIQKESAGICRQQCRWLRWKKSGEEVKKKKENETMAPISFTSAARRNETEGNKKYMILCFVQMTKRVLRIRILRVSRGEVKHLGCVCSPTWTIFKSGRKRKRNGWQGEDQGQDRVCVGFDVFSARSLVSVGHTCQNGSGHRHTVRSFVRSSADIEVSGRSRDDSTQGGGLAAPLPSGGFSSWSK